MCSEFSYEFIIQGVLMKKIKGKGAVLLFALIAAVSFGNTTTEAASDIVKGKWELKDGNWKFYDESNQAKTGWIHTDSGWYFLDLLSGNMLIKWQKIDGSYYYFDTKEEGTAGNMHTGWYQTSNGKWYFFNNVDSDATQGKMLTGWQWIDGYCYYFESKSDSEYGSMYTNRITPDGFKVDGEGRWTDDNGKVQFKENKGFSTKKSVDKKNDATVIVSRSRGGSGSSGGSYPNKPEKPQRPQVPEKPHEPQRPQVPEKPHEPQKPQVPEKPHEPQKPHEPKEPETNKAGLADGIWYGTATWGRYLVKSGPNIVKVVIKDGKIEKAESVVYADDNATVYTERREIALKTLKGMSDTEEIKNQINARRGVYDSISGATETVRGHLSAVDNALDRSKKFNNDSKEQKIDYMEFVKRPASTTIQKNLDLSSTVFKVHLKDGQVKEVGYDEFGDYDIKTEPEHGSVLPEIGKRLKVEFKNEASIISIPTEVETVLEKTKKYPTHITISYEDGSEHKITLNNDNWRYTVESKGKIKEMSIYDNEKKLIQGVYDATLGRWSFNLKTVPHEGFDFWGFETYVVIVETKNDTSEIASFEIDSKNIKTSYYIGDNLDINNLLIKAVTQKGNNVHFANWEECKKAGFSSEPDNNYQFTMADKGTKSIKISYNKSGKTLEKSFNITVEDPEVQMPASIGLYDGGIKVTEITIDAQELKERQGRLIIRNVEIPERYKNWNESTFTVKALNKAGDSLKTKLSKKASIFKIDFPDYKISEGNGYVWITFKFVKVEEEGEIETRTGEAQVEDYRYTAKVKVKYNAKTGEIIEVEDNGTVPRTPHDKGFWSLAVGIFKNMPGKTRETVDTVDAIAGATKSSNAIKLAVKAALPTPEAPAETNMEVLDIIVDGKPHTYYYKKYEFSNPSPELIVKGKNVKDKAVLVDNPHAHQVYYYVEDEQKLSGDVYGVADIPYAYFYFGELMPGKVPFPEKGDPDIGQPPTLVKSLTFMGSYDAVSSATTENYGKFNNVVYSNKSGSSYKITGVKTPVKIDAELYAKVKLLAAVGAENHNAFIPAVSSMTATDSQTGNKREVTSVESPVYKVFYRDCTLSEFKYSENAPELNIDASQLDISVEDQSPYGDYQINVKGLPAEIDGSTNVLGVVLNADNQDYTAKRYGLSQLDNIWTDAGQLGFSVAMRSKGGKLAHKRFALLGGHKISRITYLLSDHKKVVIDNLDLYLGNRLKNNAKAKITNNTGFEAGKGARVTFDLSSLNYKGYEVKSLKFGVGEEAKELVNGVDFNFDTAKNTLEIMDTDSTGKGNYTIVFEDKNKVNGYVSYVCEFEVGESGGSVEPEPETEVVEGEAMVDMFGYAAKVKVTYNKISGAIISVEDNGTESGSNAPFWNNAVNIFPKFVGKKKGDIDKIDAISHATLSSNAIKQAVKNAFSSSKLKTVDSFGLDSELGLDSHSKTLSFTAEPETEKSEAEAGIELKPSNSDENILNKNDSKPESDSELNKPAAETKSEAGLNKEAESKEELKPDTELNKAIKAKEEVKSAMDNKNEAELKAEAAEKAEESEETAKKAEAVKESEVIKETE